MAEEVGSNRSGGDEDCPCIDSSLILSNFSSCVVVENNSTEEEDVQGFWHASSKTCRPITYASKVCDTHDLNIDPLCVSSDDSKSKPPSYCYDSWCYIDPEKCKSSNHLYFKSSLFPGIVNGLFYSYSTCNSDAADWLEAEAVAILENRIIVASIPTYDYPYHYKENPTTGEVLSDPKGEEYYNDTIPWKGRVIEYFDTVIENSNIQKIQYTHVSQGSFATHPQSSWTSAVRDIQVGISCLGASHFWVTMERLEMVPFTTQVYTDKLYLWVDGSPHKSTFYGNAAKIFLPFDTMLWFMILFVILGVSFLSTLLEVRVSKRRIYWSHYDDVDWNTISYWRRTKIFCRVLLDSLVDDFTNAYAGGVDMDPEVRLHQKILRNGFAFFLTLVIAAYTANLAAFMTIQASYVTTVSTIDEAASKEMTICALGGMREDITRLHPSAYIHYIDSLQEMMSAYDQDNCQAILYGRTILSDPARSQDLCNRNLLSTDHVAFDKQIAFPICPDLSAGLSYWIHNAELKGISFGSYFEQDWNVPEGCTLLPEQKKAGQGDDKDLHQLHPENFAMPMVLVGVCSLIAIIMYFCLRRKSTLKKRLSIVTTSLERKPQGLPTNSSTSSSVAVGLNVGDSFLENNESTSDLDVRWQEKVLLAVRELQTQQTLQSERMEKLLLSSQSSNALSLKEE